MTSDGRPPAARTASALVVATAIATGHTVPGVVRPDLVRTGPPARPADAFSGVDAGEKAA